MIIMRCYRDPMTRQVSEGTNVRRLEVADESEDAICLNSRLDWVQTAKVNLVARRGEAKENPLANQQTIDDIGLTYAEWNVPQWTYGQSLVVLFI